jgi:hypothetical protein
MKLRKRVLLAAVFMLVALPAGAEERHLGAHVHGQATVGVSIEGPQFDLQLSLPGHDAVGFEHPPGSAEETRTLAHAKQVLRSAKWIEPPQAAGCKLQQANVVANGFDGAAAPGGHADFDVDYRFQCAQADKLNAVDLRLVDAFPSVQKVVVDVISATGSQQQILERGVVRVDLGQ